MILSGCVLDPGCRSMPFVLSSHQVAKENKFLSHIDSKQFPSIRGHSAEYLVNVHQPVTERACDRALSISLHRSEQDGRSPQLERDPSLIAVWPTI